MKKRLLLVGSIVAMSSMVFFSSCKKDECEACGQKISQDDLDNSGVTCKDMQDACSALDGLGDLF